MTTSILIADDHGVLRAGLRSLLNSEPDLQVVGEAADGPAAIAEALRLTPDVVLADISMPGANGIQVTRELHKQSPEIRVLILTMHEDACLADEALAAGARGYLPKRAAESELIDAIRAVARGATYLQAEMLRQRRAEALAEELGDDCPPLEAQELELVRLLALGNTGHQVATEMGLSPQLVEGMRRAVQEKLGVRSRVDLVKYARAHGLLVD